MFEISRAEWGEMDLGKGEMEVLLGGVGAFSNIDA